MSELRVDVSDLKSERGNLVKELVIFLEEKANVKVETIANEIIVKGEEDISRKCLRALLKDFLQKVGVKGKVKKGKGKNLIVTKSKGKPIFCGEDGMWKDELKKRLSTSDDEIVVLALGDVKRDVLAYLNSRKDIEIMKLETRYMKKLEKGTGLKATVRSRSKPDNLQKL